MRPKPFLLTIFYLLLNVVTTAQQPSDCVTAIEVCDTDSITLQYNNLKGEYTEIIANPCLPNISSDYLETNTLWLKYTFKRSGQFLFVIDPLDPLSDIDFTVFKSAGGSCQDLNMIRCMFSGEQGGGEIDTMCLGRTGLSGEATDTIESGGCLPTDDNFLSTVEVSEGDIVFLAITLFSSDNRFLLEYPGDTDLSCTTSLQFAAKKSNPTIYPNPAEEYFTIGGEINTGDIESIFIWNLQGRKILKNKYNGESINISTLPPGLYVVELLEQRSVPIHLMLVVEDT